MEIPVINRISDFETDITSLQNPTFLSQIFALSGVGKIHQAYSFWKWGALILALAASFTTIINRIKILIIRFKNYTFISSPSLITYQEDCDYESETDWSCSSSISLSDDEQEEESTSSTRSWWSINDHDHDQDFRVRGSGNCYIDDQFQSGNFRLRRRRNSSIGDFFSLTELTKGKSVVKLWDNLGLGLELNLNSSCGSGNAAFSFYDINKEQKICSIFGSKCDNFAAVSKSPSVVVSAETNLSGHSSLSLWDTRVGSRVPEVSAELRHMLGKIAGVSGGVEKFYVRDDVTGELTVGDMRKASSPLVNVTESDMDTWWDADAVIVDDECEDSV